MNYACQYGDKNGTETVVLYGDSHAGMWVSAFDVAGRRTHTKIVLLAKPACAVPALQSPLPTLISGDLALTSTPSKDGTGVRTQVVRRQPDGSWLRVIDRPELKPPDAARR